MSPAPRPALWELRAALRRFLDEVVLPAEEVAARQLAAAPDSHDAPPVMAELKAEARSRGLWNLFPLADERSAGLSQREYAELAEVTGWSPQLAPEAVNCSAPDTGNMELLHRFGTDSQRARWLDPLLAGAGRSCFAMTEPDVASSDASNVGLRIHDAGDSWVLEGRKWWTTAALRSDCEVALVMGVTDPDAAPGRRHSIVLVPMDTPGLDVVRSTSVMGFDDRHEGGHGELVFHEARVPKDALLGEQGAGFAVAQVRLGPGRIHHCMRLVGMGERALQSMVRRATERVAFGQRLIDHGMTQQRIADSRTTLDAARLLVLRAAARLDAEGSKAARTDVAVAKLYVPAAVRTVVDHAIQVFGGAGVSQDTVLPMLHAQARFLQIADGPDDVHRRSIARAEEAALTGVSR